MENRTECMEQWNPQERDIHMLEIKPRAMFLKGKSVSAGFIVTRVKFGEETCLGVGECALLVSVSRVPCFRLSSVLPRPASASP